MNQDQYKTIWYWKSACYLILMNGPVEQGFLARDLICMMVFHVIREDQLSSFLLEFETLPWPGNSLDVNPVKKL